MLIYSNLPGKNVIFFWKCGIIFGELRKDILNHEKITFFDHYLHGSSLYQES